MKTEFTGKVVDGKLTLDEPIQLPDHSQVQVIVCPVGNADTQAPANGFDADHLTPAERLARFREWTRMNDLYPIRAGRTRFTRDELHERR